MSAWRNVALATLVWSGLARPAKAIPLSWMTSSTSQGWSVWSNGNRVSTTTTTTSSPAPAPVFNTPPPTPIATTPTAPTVFAKTTPTGLVPASSYQGKPDAFINFGNGTYSDADMLVSGSIRPWYESPSVSKVFGGTPNASQQQSFVSNVLQDVQDTFARSGLYPKLTVDPNNTADHTMSVVSGASYVGNSNAIGITNVGYNGFGFIDKLNYAKSPEELARAVASNVSHELMHAFGVGAHPDKSGEYLDSATASWGLLTDSNATFSQEAVKDLLSDKPSFNPDAARSLSAQMLGGEDGDCHCLNCETPGTHEQLGTQLITPAPVPEPAALAVWAVGGGLLLGLHRRRASGRVAA